MIALTQDPLAPGRDTARQWAADELAHPAYASSRPSLTERILSRLGDLLDRVANAAGLSGGQLVALLLCVVVAVVVVIVLVHRRVRFTVARTDLGNAVLGSSARTGAQHRDLADAAEARGQLDVAVLERMRAVARRLEERAILDPRPGRTADELARDAGQLLPGLSVELAAGARAFDDVFYGSVQANPTHVAQLRALDQAVESARPLQPATTGSWS